jgi:hypothetical protein
LGFYELGDMTRESVETERPLCGKLRLHNFETSVYGSRCTLMNFGRHVLRHCVSWDDGEHDKHGY